MSQAKVEKNKTEKRNRKNLQQKKARRNLGWIIAGCVIFGLLAGFCLGKYWIYPQYRNQSESEEDIVYDSQDLILELQDLNNQPDNE